MIYISFACIQSVQNWTPRLSGDGRRRWWQIHTNQSLNTRHNLKCVESTWMTSVSIDTSRGNALCDYAGNTKHCEISLHRKSPIPNGRTLPKWSRLGVTCTWNSTYHLCWFTRLSFFFFFFLYAFLSWMRNLLGGATFCAGFPECEFITINLFQESSVGTARKSSIQVNTDILIPAHVHRRYISQTRI